MIIQKKSVEICGNLCNLWTIKNTSLWIKYNLINVNKNTYWGIILTQHLYYGF